MSNATGNTQAKFDTRTVIVDGLTIRYAAQARPGKPTVVLLSPWPESIYAWWPMWPHLAANFDLLAVDLPGFGQSDGRRNLMSPKAMGSFIPKIIDALKITLPHVVGPDVGTAALLFTAALRPDSVASIIIGGGAATSPLQTTGLLQQFIEAPSLDPFRALDPAEVAGGAVKSIPGYTPPEFVVDDYVASYSGTRFVESIEYVRAYPTDLAELAELLPDIQTPVGILAASNDPFLKLTDPEELDAVLPHSQLTVLKNSHNAWEESPEDYAAAITAWVSAGYEK